MLDIPDRVGNFDSLLIRRALRRFGSQLSRDYTAGATCSSLISASAVASFSDTADVQIGCGIRRCVVRRGGVATLRGHKQGGAGARGAVGSRHRLPRGR